MRAIWIDRKGSSRSIPRADFHASSGPEIRCTLGRGSGGSWDRIAVVTDHDGLGAMVKGLGWLILARSAVRSRRTRRGEELGERLVVRSRREIHVSAE